uniref:Uncharacterized protein n=1 Tax=Arundo donax TaxID=35708 RepID=A0A0A9HGW9_ARUDO
MAFSARHLYTTNDHHLPPLQLPTARNALDPLAGRPVMPSSLLRPLHCNPELQAATAHPLTSMASPMPVASVSSMQSTAISSPASVPAVDKGLLDDMVPPAMRHG